VRELQNAIESAAVMGAGDAIAPEDLPETILEAAPPPAFAADSYHGSVRRQKSETILAAIEAAGGNITQAAKLLHLHPNYLHRLIRNLGLRGKVRKPTPARPGS
jgi:DNA-binding NtrC family response regulator